MIAPRKLTGLAGRLGPGAGPPGGPPGGPLGPGGGGAPGKLPDPGGGGAPGKLPDPGGGGAPGVLEGPTGEVIPLVFNAPISLLKVFILVCKLESCSFIPANDWSTKSGILKIILMIFSTISPNALTFSSMGDLRASERKLANSSAISNHHLIKINIYIF